MATLPNGKANAQVKSDFLQDVFSVYFKLNQENPKHEFADNYLGNEFIGASPAIADALNMEGDRAYNANNHSGAIRTYTAEINFREKEIENCTSQEFMQYMKLSTAYFSRGRARSVKGNTDVAVSDFDKAITVLSEIKINCENTAKTEGTELTEEWANTMVRLAKYSSKASAFLEEQKHSMEGPNNKNALDKIAKQQARYFGLAAKLCDDLGKSKYGTAEHNKYNVWASKSQEYTRKTSKLVASS